jgi:hypothetical protein
VAPLPLDHIKVTFGPVSVLPAVGVVKVAAVPVTVWVKTPDVLEELLLSPP